MRRPPHLCLPGVLFVALTACSNEVAIVSGSGSGSTGNGASGGAGGASPHSVVIDVVGGPTEYEENILVLLNHEDGTLVASWAGPELPITVDALDGDLVSYVHWEELSISSYRVESGVDRVKKTFFETGEPADGKCDHMTVDVHIPSIPGAVSAVVRTAGNGTTDTFPAVVPVQVLTCKSTVDVLTTVEGPAGWVAFERQTLPFVSDASVSLEPTFASPRKKLTVDLDGMEGALEAYGHVDWVDERFGHLDEPGNESFALGGAPTFLLEMSLVDLPNGRPFFWGLVSFPPPAAACRVYSLLQRWGTSDSPIPFHASELGAPTVDGASWKLEGALGTRVVREYKGSPSPHWSWFVTDDARMPRSAVLPTIPGDPPPLGDLQLTKITHHDDYGASYAERLSDVPLSDDTLMGSLLPQTTIGTRRARQTSYVCD